MKLSLTIYNRTQKDAVSCIRIGHRRQEGHDSYTGLLYLFIILLPLCVQGRRLIFVYLHLHLAVHARVTDLRDRKEYVEKRTAEIVCVWGEG